MIRILLILASAHLFSFAHAQNKITDSTATVVGFWANKENKYFRFTQKEWSQNMGDTAQPSPVITEYFAQVRVLDSNEAGYVIEWTLKGVKSMNSPDPNSQRIFAISEGLRFVYTTDQAGAFGDLLNIEEVKSHIYRGFDSIMADKSFIVEARENLGKIRDRMLEDANIEQLYLEDIRYMHYMYGYEFHKSHPMQFETELENAEGGEPLKAQNEISLSHISPATDEMRLLMRSSIDKEQGRKLLNNVKGPGPDTGVSAAGPEGLPQSIAKPSSLEIDLNMSYNFSIRTGWPHNFTYVKQVRSGEQLHFKRIDIRDFEFAVE